MMESKRWFNSKGIWGGIGAILGGVGMLVQGFDPQAVIASLASNLEAWYVLATGILAAVGRAVASTQITK